MTASGAVPEGNRKLSGLEALHIHKCAGTLLDASTEVSMNKLILLFVISAFTLPSHAALLVSGRVVQDFTPRSWQQPFQVTADSLAYVVLEVGCVGDFADRSCEQGLHQEMKVTRLPFTFSVETNDPKIKCTAVNGQLCYLSVLVESRKGTTRIGDLFSEDSVMVISPARAFELKAEGLEPCDAPNAGGTCL